MKYFVINIVTTLTIALGLTLTVLWSLASAGELSTARATSLTVCPSGPTTCDYATIQAAVDAAHEGDVIKVATGVYTGINTYGGTQQVVYISKTVTIQGGYSTTNWIAAYPVTQPTVLDAQGKGRVISLVGNITPTLEGLRITNGASDFGGGILASAAHPAISGCQVYSNVAAMQGGGVYLSSAPATLIDNSIYGNMAGEAGGGVSVRGSASTLSVGNQVYSNSALTGGGIEVGYSDNARLTGNQVYSNTANTSGGGIYIWDSDAITLTNNQIRSNAVASGNGGGVFFTHVHTSTLTNNNVYSNTADNEGGGIYLSNGSALLADNNQIFWNSATVGGGMAIHSSHHVTLTGNQVYNNSVRDAGGGLYAWGSSFMTLADNQFSGNAATQGNGGGLFFSAIYTSSLMHNQIYSNVAGSGGGIYLTSGRLGIERNLIANNRANTDGGGIRVFDTILGLYNNMIVDNATPRRDGVGGIDFQYGSNGVLVHNTIARNVGPNGGYGILMAGQEAGTELLVLALYNNIVVSHTVGISVTQGRAVALNGTLFGTGDWVNGLDWSGAGQVLTYANVWGDPHFVSPPMSDYHIHPDSAAVDAGIRYYVGTDFDGTPRPIGLPDIGADEWGTRTFLPLVLK
jgi:parallel beta-helix repeat protein